MRVLAALLALCGACVTEQHSEPDPAPTVQPRSCSAEIQLDAGAPSVQLGPYTLDRNGMTVCLRLDATQYLQAAHFATASDYQAGSESSVASVLQDMSFVALQDSWDVSIGEPDPHTFSNLEWNAPLHSVTDAMLWLHARDQAASSSFKISLFEPYE
jgi:hypothetical protein